MSDWVVFGLSSLVIVVAGYGLAVCADVLARLTGLGALWFGAVVVGAITSMPELVTDISAVRRDAADLALGDLMGSSMSNMAILGAVTLVFTRRRLLQRAALEHVLTAAIAISVTAIFLLFANSQGGRSVGIVSIGPVAIAAVYLAGTVAIRERQAAAALAHEPDVAAGLTPMQAALGFVTAAVAIFVAGPFLAESADALAEKTGLGGTFFGSAALATVTSLPELAVTVSALRMAALNLAIGNLLGSNALNMSLLLPLDLAYGGEPLLSVADAGHLTAASAAILMMAIGTTSIVLKAERGRLPVDLAAVLMLVAYAAGMFAVYEAGT